MAGKFALFIGNNEYEDETLSKLKTPVADVHALAGAMRNPEIGCFDEVTELINQDETNIRRAINRFFGQKKPDDLLMLYFSGHGILDDQGRLFLAVKDTRRDLLKATSVPAGFVTSEMDDCRSKRQILILDCCHSGAFIRGGKGQTSFNETTFKGNGYGRVVLTASNSTQYALEGDKVIKQAELSLFSHYLLEGLITGDADANGDGLISLDDWYGYAYEKIVVHTPQQTPQKWTYSQQGDLMIAKNPRPKAIKPAPLPVELLQLLESPFSAVRTGVVQELGRLLKGSDKALALAAFETLKKMTDDDSRQVQALAIKILTEHEECQDQTTKAPKQGNIGIVNVTSDKSAPEIKSGSGNMADNKFAPNHKVSSSEHKSLFHWGLWLNWTLKNTLGWVVTIIIITTLLKFSMFRVENLEDYYHFTYWVAWFYRWAFVSIIAIWLLTAITLILPNHERLARTQLGWWALSCSFGSAVGYSFGFATVKLFTFGAFLGALGGFIVGLITWQGRPKDLFDSNWKTSAILFGGLSSAIVALSIAVTRLSLGPVHVYSDYTYSISADLIDWFSGGIIGSIIGGAFTGIILVLWMVSYKKSKLLR